MLPELFVFANFCVQAQSLPGEIVACAIYWVVANTTT